MCIKGLTKVFHVCQCPQDTSDTDKGFDSFVVKPSRTSPVDRLGYTMKCCYCIPLRAAAIMICIISFIWAVYELQTAEKFIGRMFSNKGDVFFYTKVVYMLFCAAFVIFSGVLMLGIILRKLCPVHAYVWFAFIFVSVSIVLTFMALVIGVTSKSGSTKKHSVRAAIALMWNCIFIYFIIVVNSFKNMMW